MREAVDRTNFLGNAAYLITLLVLVVVQNSAHSVPVGNRYAVVYYGYISPDLAKLFIKRNYTIIIASSEITVPDILKRSGIKVYGYLDILGLPMEQLSWVKENHPEWILYTKDGKLATYWFNTNFICNIAEKSFQDYLISKAKNILSKGFDGLFLDDVVLDIVGSYNVAYNESAYGSWSDALLNFFKRLKSETNASIIYNAGWAPPSAKLMEVADGVLLESHPGSWRGSLSSPTYYYRDWTEIYSISLEAQKFAEKGKIVIALSYGASPEAEEYTYAVTRLFDFYYWFSTPDLSKVPDAKVLNISLGNPLGTYKEKDGVFYRIYENGVVVVSTSTTHNEVKLEVPKHWKELRRLNGEKVIVENGTIILKLEPYKGIVLLLVSQESATSNGPLARIVYPLVVVVVILGIAQLASRRLSRLKSLPRARFRSRLSGRPHRRNLREFRLGPVEMPG